MLQNKLQVFFAARFTVALPVNTSWLVSRDQKIIVSLGTNH